jgi:hypothetical protein
MDLKATDIQIFGAPRIARFTFFWLDKDIWDAKPKKLLIDIKLSSQIIHELFRFVLFIYLFFLVVLD